jgi:hypothetical protein
MRRTYLLAAALSAVTTPAAAATVVDPAGDFLATYSGPQTGNLDVLGASATSDGTNLFLSAVLNGAVGGSGSLYVFGINRGAGTARLAGGSPSVGASVLFDAVAVLFPDGTGRIATFPAAGAPTITNLPGAVTVSGNSISGTFALSLLPSTGFDPSNYTYTLWSRQRVNPAADGTNAEIADFAPPVLASAVPEPRSWLMMLLGFGAVGSLLRRRKPALRPITSGR